jgi:hypothetical protein
MRAFPAARLVRCDPVEGGWLIAWSTGNNQTFWRLTLELVKALPAELRYFDAVERAWWVSDLLAERLQGVFSNANECFQRQNLPAPRPVMPPDVAAAYAALHLTFDAPVEVIQAVYRAMLQSHSSTATAQIIQDCYSRARMWAEQHRVTNRQKERNTR